MLLVVLAFFALFASINGEETGNVAFTASIDEFKTIGANTVVKFTKVFTNYGNAYNSLTGVFTASKTGLYVFHFHALARHNSGFWFCLYHNEVCLIKAHGKVPNAFGMGGNTIVLRVKSGERVYVKTASASNLQGDGNGQYATFTGYLISL
ncbi:unnamed protein product [Candidula unifasciata]|uniref:C1q domain-containing protein n=1 Tax=Candidula unifasciata TaxID=100452 RepID=A0A8S3YXB4_9EUPU|nr:unnamed protein product [Candidula unifasciata]